MSFSTGVRLLKSSVTSNTPRALQGIAHRSFHASVARSALHTPGDETAFKNLTDATDRIAVVDFYADWCGPCRQLAPVLEKLTEEPNVSGSTGLPLDLVKVDTETEHGQAIAMQFKVRVLPTVVAFRGGKPIGQFEGALRPDAVGDFLRKL